MNDKGRTGDGDQASDNPRRLWSEGRKDPVEEARRTSPAMREQEAAESSGKDRASGWQGRPEPGKRDEKPSEASDRKSNPSDDKNAVGSASTVEAAGGQSGNSAGTKKTSGLVGKGRAEQSEKRETREGDHDEKEGRSWKLFEDVLLWAAWLVMVAFNGYAEVFKFNGTTTGAIAKSVDVWLMPAGYVFAIWGVIYIALAIWLVRFCLAGPSRKKLGFLPFTLSGLIFVATCCLNIAWLIFWHLEQGLISLIVIAVLTFLVWMLYALVRRDATKAGTPVVAKTLDWAPLSLYGSWLSVATLVNAAYAIIRSDTRVSNILQGFATVIVVGLLLALAFLMMQKMSDWVFGLVVIWACLGIGIRIFSFMAALGVLVIAMTAVGALIIYFPWNRFTLARR